MIVATRYIRIKLERSGGESSKLVQKTNWNRNISFSRIFHDETTHTDDEQEVLIGKANLLPMFPDGFQ